MRRVTARGWVDAPIEAVFAFFDDPANLGRLTPPPASVRLVRVEPDPPRAGSLLEFAYGVGAWRPLRWIVRLEERTAPVRIRDSTLSGPISRFEHTHAFVRGRRGTWVHDEVWFAVGVGGAIGPALEVLASVVMRGLFVYRHALTRMLLARR